MHHITAIVVILVIIIFLFIPAAHLIDSNAQAQSIKQDLNLSARVLAGCISNTKANYMRVSEGYKGTALMQPEIDTEKLLSDFYEMLRLNIPNDKEFYEVKECLKAKVIVYCDRFIIGDKLDRWSSPYFFVLKKDEKCVFLNTINDNAYYYDVNGQEIHTCISELGITAKEKDDAIIESVNRMIGFYTAGDTGKGKGLSINIFNQYNTDAYYKAENSYFNILEGITFFVVYDGRKNVWAGGRNIILNSCCVVGYTMNKK